MKCLTKNNFLNIGPNKKNEKRLNSESQNTYLSDDVYPEITDFIKCGGIDYKKYEDFIFENCYFYVETPLNKHIFLQL